jgi:hypothetical protein
MLQAFHCPKSRGEVIKAGREIVGSKGLFITKKRYAVLYYDQEGKRLDVDDKPGKIKAMGLDLKRSDTPEFMQEFLSKILDRVLNNAEEDEILDMITKFRIDFKSRPGWEKGSPKRANNITEYQKKEVKAGKANMPGHVRASINWNTLKKLYNDNYSITISDGAKVIVCKLKHNPMGFTSVAYPVDELRLPQWFKDLPFDDAEMEATIIDLKLKNLIGELDWDLSSTTEKTTFNNKEITTLFQGWVHVILVLLFTYLTIKEVQKVRKEARNAYQFYQMSMSKNKDHEWLKLRTVHIKGLSHEDRTGNNLKAILERVVGPDGGEVLGVHLVPDFSTQLKTEGKI